MMRTTDDLTETHSDEITMGHTHIELQQNYDSFLGSNHLHCTRTHLITSLSSHMRIRK